MIIRISDNKRSIDLLRKDFEMNKSSINQIEQIVLKKQSDVPTIFDLIQNKIADLASVTRQTEQEINKRIDVLDRREQTSEDRISSLERSHTRLDNHLRIVLTDFQHWQIDVTKFKEKIETLVKEESDQVTTKWAQVKLNVKQVNDLIGDLQKQSNYNSDDISQHTKQLVTQQEFIDQINRKIARLDNVKLEAIVFDQHDKESFEKIKYLRNKIDDIGNCLKETDNYLEKYLPFNSFCQLFEVLRMALDSSSINKVKDYEEYRLKELYDIILQDEGEPRTCFDKKYLIQPVGYSFDNFSDGHKIKLQSKSRRFIVGRPSFTSAIKFSSMQNQEQLIEAAQSALKQKTSYNRPNKTFFRSSTKTNQQLQKLTMDRKYQSAKDDMAIHPKQDTKAQKFMEVSSQIAAHNIVDPNKQEQPTPAEDEGEEQEENLESELEDAIDDLLDNEHENNSSLGIKNLGKLKRKLFDPEFEIIYKKYDDKIKTSFHDFKKELEDFKQEIYKALQSKQVLLEVFEQEIESFEKRIKQNNEQNQLEIQKQNMKLEKLQNMYNYLDKLIQKPQFNRNNPMTPISNQYQNSASKSRNLLLMNEYPTNQTNASTKVSQFNTTMDYLKHYSQQHNLVVRGRTPVAVKTNPSLNNTFVSDEMHLHSNAMFTCDQRPKTAVSRDNQQIVNVKIQFIYRPIIKR